MRKHILGLCIIGIALLHEGVCVYTPAAEKTVRDNTLLHATYVATSRPSAVTHVKASLSILSISELDLKGQKFIAAGWLTMEWEDSRLTWDNVAEGIDYIFAEPSKIWKPELVVDNSLANLGVINDDYLLLRVKYTGLVEWEPAVLFTTHCNVDVTYYPYDQQKCGVELMSWGYLSTEVTLEHLETEVLMTSYQENGEWVVLSTEVDLTSVSEQLDGVTVSHPQMEFYVILQRRTDFYNSNVMLPIVLTSFLMVLAFVVPVDSGEKLSYALTVLLTIAVLLTLIANSLPSTSITTAVLGMYLATILVVAAFSVLVTVGILMVHHQKKDFTKNNYLYKMSTVASVLLCKKKRKRPTSAKSGRSSKVDPGGNANGNVTYLDDDDDDDDVSSWERVAVTFDRLAFVIFLILTLLVNISYITALVVGGNVNTK